MPFTPLPETDPQKPTGADLGLLMIRFVAVAAFFYYQLIDQLDLARLYLWEKTEWDLVTQLSERELPFPGPVACFLVLVFTFSLLGALVGIFTRINSLILLLATGFILLAPIELSTFLTPQALVLYLGIFLGLSLGGAGRLSLDHVLSKRKRKEKE